MTRYVTNALDHHDLWPDNVVKWLSRRGILELDYILMPFFTRYYRSVSDNGRLTHQWLLLQTDTDLQTWLVRRQSIAMLTRDQQAWIYYVLACTRTIHTSIV